MNLVDLLKKNIVMVPVVASVLVGTFTGVRYVVNLTDSINGSEQEIVHLQRDLTVAEEKIAEMNILTTVLILVALDLLISPWNKEIPIIITGTTAILMIMTTIVMINQ